MLFVNISNNLKPLKEAWHYIFKCQCVWPFLLNLPLFKELELFNYNTLLLNFIDVNLFPSVLKQCSLFVIKTHKLVSSRVSVNILFPRAGQNKRLDILHQDFFFLLARSVQLSMSLIDVGFDLVELLNSPFGDINQSLDLFSCWCI